jgi:hypothetical protein
MAVPGHLHRLSCFSRRRASGSARENFAEGQRPFSRSGSRVHSRKAHAFDITALIPKSCLALELLPLWTRPVALPVQIPPNPGGGGGCSCRVFAAAPPLLIVHVRWPLSVPMCASLAWPSEWREPRLLDFCFCSALTGVVHWSVPDSLVRGVWCSLRWLSRTYVGVARGRCARVMGACCAACPQRLM